MFFPEFGAVATTFVLLTGFGRFVGRGVGLGAESPAEVLESPPDFDRQAGSYE